MIETLFATFVILLTLSALLGAISKGVSVAPTVRQDLVGARLAEEGIDLVRNLRDQNLLAIAEQLQRGASVTCQWHDGWPGIAKDLDCPNTVLPSTAGLNLNACDGAWQRLALRSIGDVGAGWRIACAEGSGIFAGSNVVYQHDALGVYANLCSRSGVPGDSCCSGGVCGGWTATDFRREVRFTNVPPSCTAACTESQVQVRVFWGSSSGTPCPGPQCVLLEDRLQKWTDYLENFL